MDYTYSEEQSGSKNNQHLGKKETRLAKTRSGKAMIEQGTRGKREFS